MALRRVLHAYRDGWLPEARLSAAARMTADDARLAGLDAAGMLVALKREWHALPEVRRLTPFDSAELLRRLVTLGIAAYYEADRAGALPGAPPR